MANSEKRITQLHRLRGALKTKSTVLEKFLKKSIAEIHLIELKGKVKDVTLIAENFEKIQSELKEIVSDDEIENEYTQRADFEEKLSALSAKAQAILIKIDTESLSDSPITNNASTSNNFLNINQLQTNMAGLNIGAQQSFANAINIKLPALSLPTFSGSYEQWPGFSDVFKSSVENDQRFTNSQKLIYLRSCLTGRAADKIESLQTTDANYQVAWNILQKSYDDPTFVINNHIKSFFELPNCHNPSAFSLGELLNNVTKHYRALEALNRPFLEAFPIYAIVSKLDPQTRLKWKEHVSSNPSPSMEQLLEFLHSRERILESNKPFVEKRSEKNVPRSENKLHSGNRPVKSQPNVQRQSSYAIHTRTYCYICKESHFTQNCEKLVKSNLQERWNLIKSLNLCCNCLRSNHTVENCNATACKTCSQKHHTILHPENKNQKSFQTNHANLHNNLPSQFLLSTASINILDNKGIPHACRALLDNGSQVHFMTEKLAEKLGLNQREIEIPLGGVNQMTSSVSKITRTTIQSRLNKYSTDITFLITPEVNNRTPSEPLNVMELKIPPNIHLADPEFSRPSEIDILIGAEIFLKLLCVGQISLANGNVTLQKTHFGWILGGKTPGVAFPIVPKCNLSFNLLNKKICEFWEIENGPNERLKSHEENACEIHVQENTRRDSETGRYIVKLPFKEDSIGLGESYSQALKRFHSLERSLVRNPELKDKYIEFMREYSELDHMSEDKSASICDAYFLPHHAIIKQSSLTNKLRTVFDASAKTSNGNSLNDILMVGPNIQENLFSLLLRFRSHIFAVTADIEKMYRQILVNQNDQKFQKILWRENSHQPVKIFRLKTVTYGTSPASFLATRALVQLADDEARAYPRASIALREDFYMDDLLSGARSIEEAKQLIAELMTVTRKGGMNLRKWVSNAPELITSLSEDFSDTYLRLDLGDTTKTLGVYWNPKPDSFFYTVKQSKANAPVTKRNILSEIAELFDPLGLLGPVILTPKILMQSLWQLNIGWDESVPLEIAESWLELKQNLALLREVEINRKIVSDNYVSLQIHGFCDASEKAFGACIYVRSTDESGTNFTQLVCSKSRVAPLKTLSLPRLELCAAVLLSKLYSTVSQALRRLLIEKTIFWCDSTIALHWINSPPNTLKPFVGNRVAEIQTLTQSLEWRHVRTEHNPADLVSRGFAPQQLINNSFWFNGPVWINHTEENWPVSHLEPIEIPELKKPVVSLAVNLARVNDITTSLSLSSLTYAYLCIE